MGLSDLDPGAHERRPSNAGLMVGLDRRDYGKNQLRWTKASLTYKLTGNLRAVQFVLSHSTIDNTVRYLGVDIDDALTLPEWTKI